MTIEFSHKLDTEASRCHAIISHSCAVSSTADGGVRPRSRSPRSARSPAPVGDGADAGPGGRAGWGTNPAGDRRMGQDADRDMLSRLGINPDRGLPSESTMRRTLAQLDADDLDARLAGWMATRVGLLAGARVIAVDGKTVRGARTATGTPHLVAALDHAAGAVGQLAVATKSNEIPALRDLLDTLDIAGSVITADAMHCQRGNRRAHHLVRRPFRPDGQGQPADSAGRVQDTAVDGRARGHRERGQPRPPRPPHDQGRASPGLDRLPRRRPDHRLRRTRTIKGRRTTEVVYAICSMDMTAAPPATVATWIQGHWGIENALHRVRDVVFGEGHHQLRTGSGPQVMANLHNTAISLLRLTGHTKIAAARRHDGRAASRPIDLMLTA